MTAKQRRRKGRRGVDGSVYRRGHKWAYVVDLGPDPLTLERRRDSRSGYLTEDEAWDALADANAKLKANSYVRNAPRTVRQFFTEWLVAQKMALKPTTYGNYKQYIENYVLPKLGDRKLQDVESETITMLYAHLLENGRRRQDSTNLMMFAEWKRAEASGREAKPRELAEAAGVSYSAAVRAAQRYRAGRVPGEPSTGLSPSSVRSVHIMLNAAFNDAVELKYIDTNPVRTAGRVRQPYRNHRTWTPDELKRFVRSARTDRLYAMWLLFATTGTRRSEAAGATPEAVDVGRKVITVIETRVVASGKAVRSDGKSEGSRRQLALDRRTLEALIQRIAEVEREKEAFGDGYTDSGLLFCWPGGKALHPDTITEQFNRLVDAAGLPHITLHDVRHTHATMSLRAGVNPKIVSARLGHATVAFTLDTYTADVPDLHHAAAETVTDLFFDPDE
ncbi:hypothetical protein GCM10009836_72260 [Pseudonocardia ailaonensis]|uniref:Site-specific integrase n=1 Tax=Pseudonocardia ailaonensis TaxID=367279 RepID=A0ABN2NPI2_9PSEU